MATRKAKQEVLNYIKVLENTEKYQEQGIITDKILLKLHKDVTRETLENPEQDRFLEQIL